MDEFDREVAALNDELAANDSDQSCTKARKIAQIVLAFDDELCQGGLPHKLANELTREFAFVLIRGRTDTHDEED